MRPPDRIDACGTIGDVAVIDGRTAELLARLLRGSLRHGLSLQRLASELGMTAEDVEAALLGQLALEQAASWHRARLPRAGNAETRGSSVRVASEQMLDSQRVAALLGRSDRRVRQLAKAGDLPGQRGPFGWRFTPADVAGFRERRAALDGSSTTSTGGVT